MYYDYAKRHVWKWIQRDQKLIAKCVFMMLDRCMRVTSARKRCFPVCISILFFHFQQTNERPRAQVTLLQEERDDLWQHMRMYSVQKTFETDFYGCLVNVRNSFKDIISRLYVFGKHPLLFHSFSMHTQIGRINRSIDSLPRRNWNENKNEYWIHRSINY